VVWAADLCDPFGGAPFGGLTRVADEREQAGRIAAFREDHPDVPVGPVGDKVTAHIPAGDGAARGAGLTMIRETWEQLLDDADAVLGSDETAAPASDP